MKHAVPFEITRRRALGVLAFAPALASAGERPPALHNEGQSPGFGGAVGWLNSARLANSDLRGKVVVVNFWTYSCINSLRELPYMKARAAKYKDAGLVVIGVHTPEFSFEKDAANVEQAVNELKVTYPVAIDSNYGVWRAFANNYWPANYFIDGKGRIRFHYFGEGAYVDSKRVIQELLRENGAQAPEGSLATASATGIEAPPGEDVRSPETYVGAARAERRLHNPPAAVASIHDVARLDLQHGTLRLDCPKPAQSPLI
jgi:thiol-disulfide isomerase/thioredoxin